MISDKKLLEALMKAYGYRDREQVMRALGIKETSEVVEVFVGPWRLGMENRTKFRIEVTKEERDFLHRLCAASSVKSEGFYQNPVLTYRDVEEFCP